MTEIPLVSAKTTPSLLLFSSTHARTTPTDIRPLRPTLPRARPTLTNLLWRYLEGKLVHYGLNNSN